MLGLIAPAQLLRVIFQLEVTIQGIDVPRWVNGVAFVVFGFLANWLWLERPKEDRPVHYGRQAAAVGAAGVRELGGPGRSGAWCPSAGTSKRGSRSSRRPVSGS